MSDFDYTKGYYRLLLIARISVLVLGVCLTMSLQMCKYRGEVIDCLDENPTFKVEQCEVKVQNEQRKQ